MRKVQLYLFLLFLMAPNSVFSGGCGEGQATADQEVINRMMNRERLVYCVSE